MAATELIFLVHESDEGGYEAAALGYSIYTQADSWDELKAAVQDAVHCHFDQGADRPAMIRLHVVHDEVIPA
ncbi:MAG: 2-oxoisovalerate dehydrogenase [Caldilineae bacterium]|nr:2-oxoisovalerate dehydrogenase [Anaerolineae bacterium]MCB0203817.1 2-oxoisovalerate dehydrogenase [Anaerolineae bacterium]MCB0254149.1 2-oxoisovalerate dehydrogenase [Anaerolineae bacterium]MCB9152799.1 2-oxoisovalerate dehydrogenase [Caldilineae bacterium]